MAVIEDVNLFQVSVSHLYIVSKSEYRPAFKLDRLHVFWLKIYLIEPKVLRC